MTSAAVANSARAVHARAREGQYLQAGSRNGVGVWVRALPPAASVPSTRRQRIPCSLKEVIDFERIDVILHHPG